MSKIHKFHIGYRSANQVGFSMSILFTYFKKILIYVFDCGRSQLWRRRSSSLTRGPGIETQAPCIGSRESWALDCRGSPLMLTLEKFAFT